MREASEGVVTGPAAAEAKRPPALSVAGVSHRFGRFEALRDVSFTVPRGAFAALLGVNGAGKTTLFSLITRLYDSTSGRIEVAGFDARRQPGEALARLGVVFQSRALDGDLTLRQNLTYHAALHGIGGRAAKARIAEVLALVGLGDRGGVKVERALGRPAAAGRDRAGAPPPAGAAAARRGDGGARPAGPRRGAGAGAAADRRGGRVDAVGDARLRRGRRRRTRW